MSCVKTNTMSEEINLSTNSLCTTTEDAFEQFQAGAILEEDGFITLSDIVSPQPEVPDLSNELNEIPYDNEVVLTSINDEDTPLNSYAESNQHLSNEHKQQNSDACENNDLLKVESSLSKATYKTSGKINKNRKRGRKKTSSIQNDTSESLSLETENNSFIDNQAIQDNVLSTTVNKNSTESIRDLQEESKYPRRTRRERVLNSHKYPQISEAFNNDIPSTKNTPGKRRGRPKRSTLENFTISEPDSTNIDTGSSVKGNLSFTENNEPLPSKQQLNSKKGRRGRPKVYQAGLEQINPNDTSITRDDIDVPLAEFKKPTRRGRKNLEESYEQPPNITEGSEKTSELNSSQLEEKEPENLNETVPENNTENILLQSDDIDIDDDDDGDNICLSKLKENIHNITENLNNIVNADDTMQSKTATIDNSDPNISIIADFEEHIDKIVKENSLDASNLDNNTDQSLLVEDTSKRPNRRKAKKKFNYEIDSDEDPFANMELSDDNKPKTKKKGKYADDDDYIPGNKRGIGPSSSDSELNEEENDLRKLKKRSSKRSRKRISDLEECTEIPLTRLDDEPLSMKPPAEAWATSNEFENFIAQKIQSSSSLKIKKVSSKQKTDNIVAPLDIPVLNQNEPKKFIESGMQTTKTLTVSTGMQTCVPYDIPVKFNLKLTPQQSEKACAFLNSVVKTTAELGQLMKDKSEDFMKKKINADNVTDTFKMDYCVRKSFLLFKLAKHNLIQMEEDLAKQYDEFLRDNKLSSSREEPKSIAPTPKADSDSDCEIVDVKEVPSTSINKTKDLKPNKTVFLNKELSIKIAKKPTADKNVDVKGRHTIWINDSVMVKKVKPTQSFLAQDSRNKKPPDYVTEKMVSDFFGNYYRQKIVALCAPYISAEWSGVHKKYACYYFVKCSDFDESDLKSSEISQNMIEINTSTSNGNYSSNELLETHKNNPKSLASFCIEVVRKCLSVHNFKEANEDITYDLADGNNRSGPLTLFRLCYQSLQIEPHCDISVELPILNNIEEKSIISLTVPTLKSLCYNRVAQLMQYEEIEENSSHINDHIHEPNFMFDESWYCENNVYSHKGEDQVSEDNFLTSFTHIDKQKDIKSLCTLCVNAIQTIFRDPDTTCNGNLENLIEISQEVSCINTESNSPKPLKLIVYENIKHTMFGNKLTKYIVEEPICQTDEVFHGQDNSEDFTINCINTMSEEAFHSLQAADEFQDEDDYEPDAEDFCDDNEEDENEWVSQVQMEVVRGGGVSCDIPVNNVSDNVSQDTAIANVCVTTSINAVENEFGDDNTENDEQLLNTPHSTLENINIVHVKQEPQDDVGENIVDSSIVKTEPALGLDGMTIIPESIVTKSEMMEHEHNTVGETDEPAELQSKAFDVNTFEQFLQRNKMMNPIDEDSDEDLFGGMRERREHEPDHDAENEMNESLLIPQTYEPLNIDNAKGVLMESSSDENKDGPKKQGKKKVEKKRGRSKKGKEVKSSNVKEIPTPTKEDPVKENPVKEKAPSNELAMLTRRMRDKIRQEEKKIDSSDSESDNIALSLRKDKIKSKDNEKVKSSKSLKQGETSSNYKNVDDEIQCNNVDSTDQSVENRPKSNDPDEFTGFSAIDQNEISSYQKYMQFVYDKIVPTEDDSKIEENVSKDKETEGSIRPSSPLINPDHPVELLECEPTMPIFDEENMRQSAKQPKKAIGKKKENKVEKAPPSFNERDGWHIYNMDPTDMKLYQKCEIPLEKLPESFVDTYLEYHDITKRDSIDKEVDRLANLQSLNRAIGPKESKIKIKQKPKSSIPSETSDNGSRAASPANSDHFAELTPSEDEGANVEDELPPPVPQNASEINIAKTSLMDDHESDSDGGTKKIKKEIIEGHLEGTKEIKKEIIEGDKCDQADQVEVKTRPGPKSKTKMNKPKVDTLPPSQSLMLTADKMMNKELTLLHAPIVMKEEVKEATPKEPSPKEETKPRKRSSRNLAMRDRLRTEDDSSSEEEKQWVSTKEKLLKRVGKKEDAIADDAKRAKLVDDFIERRGEGPENRRVQTRSRRSRKKILERLKQQRVLSKELLGEPSLDTTPGGKRGANAGLFKGRRNIRKVIDKKSLQKSTVLANMEEFERKRRLNAKLIQLRELLGCEEGVNVLVINDEVCLEYDFKEQRPVVTVHPFFTKVMKAHQYEGVKFMWDACFESLANIEAGHGGGGCILAHCMGLGKTLQVLALLHTVLTHPRSGMHRVLVCCPLSTVLNWVDEIHKWIGPVTDQIKVFELSKLKKTYERAYQLEDWYNGGGIFIIGYELFRSLTTLDPLIDEVRPTIIKKIRTALLDPGPDIIICDEGHLLKNDCSVLAVAMSRVVTRRRIILTGTPMQNNLREYYCMVNFVKPNLLGTYSEYSNRFENPIMNGQHRDSREEDIKLMKARTHILHKVLEGCLQRQEASVLYPYLPKKHEYTVFIPLTKCQWDLYKHYVHHYTKKSKQSVLRDFHILQKIWSHPLVLHNFSTREKKEIKPEKLEDDLALEDKEDIKPPATETWWLQYLADGAMLNSIDSSNKFVAVFRILQECIALGDKLLIFSTSLDCLDALEYFLRQINGWNLGQEYYRLDGSVPPEVRQKWVREYNAENNYKTKLFLISTRAGCLGLNMTAANRVIILDTSWNPAHDIQSIFRVYRFGQKKDCYIYRLVAMGTMEQKIYERSVTKQAVACRVVDEQQIDRHYNMAELTELYRFDEHGVGVAGGVAVGVGDVVLLRVARDAAIHAVHEHDSLLRGSGEQGLPEHERAAAWMQFQQEHAHKQMQNDIETSKAARAALKKLKEQEQMQLRLEQQQLLEKQQAQVLNIKTEDGPMHDLLVPRPDPPPLPGKGGGARGRGRGRRKIVQCRIPIRPDMEQPGSSRTQIMEDEDIVQQISEILIKHNYTELRNRPNQLKELVAKVKRMTQAGQVSFDECDELTASIAKVLLQRRDITSAALLTPPTPTPTPPLPPPPTPPAPIPPMPALTNIDPEPKRRGRPKKSTQNEPVAAPTPIQEQPEVEVGGRTRRRAALAAEKQFDENDDGASQDSVLADQVIELDDDDWQAAASDTDSTPEDTTLAKETTQKKKPPANQTKKNTAQPVAKTIEKPDDSSILLSDDEPSPPRPSTKPTVKIEKNNEPVNKPAPLHPSLLTNQNFIKIVAHTYLAGNPMLDEDAATLAAQYSTFKLLKESEESGKPIDSGPIYDIAVNVLGTMVLQKLQQQPSDPKNKDTGGESNAASSKMAKFLGTQDEVSPTPTPQPEPAPAPPPPAPAPVKKRPGPKSRVKPVKDEPVETAKPAASTNVTQQKPPGIVPISLLRRALGTGRASPTPAPPAQAAGECILPDDDDDVRCVTDLSPKPILFKVKLPSMKNEQPKAQPRTPEPQKPLRVTAGGNAPNTPANTSRIMSNHTICLDSDEEEPPPPPSPAVPPQRSTRALPAQYSSAGGPVPVALTGPNSQSIPLAVHPPTPAPAPSQASRLRPAFYPYPKTVTYPPEPVPVSLTGPDYQPVPISLTGPDNRPMPISLTGPGFQRMPMESTPMSFVPDNIPTSFPQPVSMPFASGVSSIPMTLMAPSMAEGVRPVAMTYSGTPQFTPGLKRTVRLSLAPGQAATALHQMSNISNNIYLVPTSTAGDHVLSRVPASQVPAGVQILPAPPPAAQPAPADPGVSKTYCRPGDILHLTACGKLKVVRSGNIPPSSDTDDVIHTIDDDEPTAPKTSASTPKCSPLAPKPPPASSQSTTMTHTTVHSNSNDDQERRKRKVSSSSSSSDSSRSASPTDADPLSILKDVVHIQAPTKSKNYTPTKSKNYTPTITSTKTDAKLKPPTNQPKSTSNPSKPSSSKQQSLQINKKNKQETSKKLSEILNAKILRAKISEGVSKSADKPVSKSAAKIKDSIDLTEINFTSVKKSMGIVKKDVPNTVVGTSKSIVLDGKSKSLTNKDMTDLSGKKSIQVTNMKMIPSTANKPKPPEKKRPTPAPDTVANKKKKTEPMTLKDFDIDDIDDIIELD